MPKVSRVPEKKHHASVKLSKTSNNDDRFSFVLPIVETTPPGLAVDQPIPGNSEPSYTIIRGKKDKQKEKHEAFLQKLGPNIQQTSKSHQRRLKRKAGEQLSGGLSDLQTALASLENEDMAEEEIPSGHAAATFVEQQQIKGTSKAGMIWKGKAAPLSNSQRKKALELERLRHPLILTNPDFSSNPFQTIRTHAKNTLLPQKPQK